MPTSLYLVIKKETRRSLSCFPNKCRLLRLRVSTDGWSSESNRSAFSSSQVKSYTFVHPLQDFALPVRTLCMLLGFNPFALQYPTRFVISMIFPSGFLNLTVFEFLLDCCNFNSLFFFATSSGCRTL